MNQKNKVETKVQAKYKTPYGNTGSSYGIGFNGETLYVCDNGIRMFS